MTGLGFLLVGGVLVVVGGGILYGELPELQTVYHILRDDPLPVRELARKSSPAEIEGTARPTDEGKTVFAPLTQTECLAYEYEAQELKSSGNNNYWETLDEGGASAPFLVEDDTGAVRIDNSEAALHLEDHTTRVKSGEEPPPTIAQYISRTPDVDRTQTVNLIVTELDYSNDQRFIERRLDIGESAHAYGTVERAPTGEWGSRLVDAQLTADEETPLVVSDSSERGTAWHIAKRPLVGTAVGVVFLAPGLWAVGYGALRFLA